jgi:PKD repeat protein
VKLFIDGKCMGAVEFTTGTNYTEFLNSIGIVKHRYDGTNHGFFNGVIDEVRIYERPLHVKEIEALYQNVLVADFEVNDTSGSMLKPFHFQNNSFSENGITTYQWDFNNDGTIDDTNPNPTFNYNQHGSNDVKLIVSDGSDQGTVHSWHSSINTLRKDNFCVPESQVPGTVEVEENWQFTEQTSYYSWNSASRKNYKYVRSPLSDSEVGLEQSSGNAGNNYTSFQMPADFSLSVTGNGNQQPTRQKVLSVNYYGDLNARVGWEFFNDWCFGDDKHYLLKDYPEVSQGIKMYIELAGYSGTASGTTSKKEFTITLNS